MPPRMAGMFYQAVVAEVLPYSSERWCLPATARCPLECFHVKVARRLTCMRPKVIKEEWICLHFTNVLQATGLRTLEHYIDKRRHTIGNTIRDLPMLDECRGAEKATSIPRRLN